MKSLVIVSKGLAPYRVRFYSEVAKSLASRGWKVSLLVAKLGARDHPWKDAGQSNQGLDIIDVGPASDQSPLRRWVDRLGRLLTKSDPEIPTTALLRELSRLKPDCVWTHEYSPFCLAAAFWAAARDVVCVLSSDLGASPPPHSCTPLQLSLHRKMAFLYIGVIAQTKEATRRWPDSQLPITFAPHAIDTAEYFPSPDTTKKCVRFLFTAGVRREKGIEQTIEAARILAAEGYDFELRVVGTGPLAGWLSQQTDRWLSIGGFIEGEALREEYRNSDVYVLPTEGDTYGVTVHEAAASGLPLIVGKNAGAAETLVEHGVSGYQIDHDDIPALAGKMRILLDDVMLRKSMASAARRLAEPLDVKTLGNTTASFIENLTSHADTKEARRPGEPEPSGSPAEIAPFVRPWGTQKIAAVFATMNRSAVAAECIRRLANQTAIPSKLFVTDNASSDDTCQELEAVAAESGLPFELIRSKINLGNAGGIKLAVDQAFDQGYDAVWILDDDSWPEPQAFEMLLDADGPAEGIRTSMVLAPDSTELSWPCEIMSPGGSWQNPETLKSLRQSGWIRVRRSWLGSLVPRSAYLHVGPLNPDLFLRGEDEDYPRALEAAGYPFWMATRSILNHPVAGPLVTLTVGENKLCLERNLGSDKLYYRIRNMLWIKRKESGTLISVALAVGYLVLIIRWFRPLFPVLGVFVEAAVDAFHGRLGRRAARNESN